MEERPDPVGLRERDDSTTPVIVDMDNSNNTRHNNTNDGWMIRPPFQPITLRSGEEVNAKNTLQSHSIFGSMIPASRHGSMAPSPGAPHWVDNNDKDAVAGNNKNRRLDRAAVLPNTSTVVRARGGDATRDPDLFASAMVLNEDDDGCNNNNNGHNHATLGRTTPPHGNPILVVLPAPIIEPNNNNNESDGNNIESPNNNGAHGAASADNKAPTTTDNRSAFVVSSIRWIFGLLIVLILAIVSVAVVAGICGTGGCGGTTRSTSVSPQQIVVITASPTSVAPPTGILPDTIKSNSPVTTPIPSAVPSAMPSAVPSATPAVTSAPSNPFPEPIEPIRPFRVRTEHT